MAVTSSELFAAAAAMRANAEEHLKLIAPMVKARATFAEIGAVQDEAREMRREAGILLRRARAAQKRERR